MDDHYSGSLAFREAREEVGPLIGILFPVLGGLAVGSWLHREFAPDLPVAGLQLFLCITLPALPGVLARTLSVFIDELSVINSFPVVDRCHSNFRRHLYSASKYQPAIRPIKQRTNELRPLGRRLDSYRRSHLKPRTTVVPFLFRDGAVGSTLLTP